ncbi:hypothetical protein IPA_07295 [Ignicoccus pacificus DSM 13166]|uniref:Uncharacterized protein n=1 Tax=Ignicoccus pacificus DSM 13166 TaxID=940294 RepID=A0A977K9X0_9CREN|nr:hypothetical protein IPA_07295 [Ignicoccus pacificus DSM 13166]
MESIKVSRRAKRRLEEMQARLTLETGRKVKLVELIDAIVDVASEDLEKLKVRLGLWRPLESAEEVLEELSFEGPEKSSEEVDEVLYS